MAVSVGEPTNTTKNQSLVVKQAQSLRVSNDGNFSKANSILTKELMPSNDESIVQKLKDNCASG